VAVEGLVPRAALHSCRYISTCFTAVSYLYTLSYFRTTYLWRTAISLRALSRWQIFYQKQ